jgi:hypothetical protein
MRLRLLWGMLLLIAGLGLYVLLAMIVAANFLPADGVMAFLYYFVAGTLWLYPAARLTKWMQDLPPPPDRFAP